MSKARKITLSRRGNGGSKSMAFTIDDHEGAQLGDNMCVSIAITSEDGAQTIRMPRYKLQDMLEQLYSK
jgi:hypothetical protein